MQETMENLQIKRKEEFAKLGECVYIQGVYKGLESSHIKEISDLNQKIHDLTPKAQPALETVPAAAAPSPAV